MFWPFTEANGHVVSKLLFGSNANIYWILLVSLIILVGTCSLLNALFKLLCFSWKHSMRWQIKFYDSYAEKDSYCVVTGGSDGIGLAMCHQMAARNFNICIIGRNEAKMQEKIEELKLKYPKVKYMYLVVDFSKLSSLEEYQQLVGDKLKEVDVAMLILNAGLASMGRFAQLTGETVQSVVNVNALHPLYTTKVLLNQMLARKKRSGIIVVGSVAGSRAMSGQLCYSATKSFASIMGQCLHFECKDKIDVISWEPGYVATKLSKMRPSLLCLPVLNAVQGILKDVGRDSRSGGDATHEITRSALQLIPDSTLQPKMLKSADHVFKRQQQKAAEASKKAN